MVFCGGLRQLLGIDVTSRVSHLEAKSCSEISSALLHGKHDYMKIYDRWKELPPPHLTPPPSGNISSSGLSGEGSLLHRCSAQAHTGQLHSRRVEIHETSVLGWGVKREGRGEDGGAGEGAATEKSLRVSEKRKGLRPSHPRCYFYPCL